MPQVKFIRPDRTAKVVTIPAGSTVMQAAVSNGVNGIVGECGGSAMCATCHVYVVSPEAEAWPPISSIEDEMLNCTVSERQSNSRLGCQLVLAETSAEVVVELPERQQ